ncbi:hypothetical protein HYQ44_005674 [Verticillium longisporum]|nr:hypothetical protein HYQ44_005674 [Verticillium longisporum]
MSHGPQIQYPFQRPLCRLVAIASSSPLALPAVEGLVPPRSKACRTPSKYSFRFLSRVATRLSLFAGR